MEEIKIKIAATFTAEPVKGAFEFLSNVVKVPVELSFAPFNQVFQELLTPGSEFEQNRKGANLILVRLEDLGAGAGEAEKMSRTVDELIAALQGGAERFQVPMVVAICPPSSVLLAGEATRRNLSDSQEKLTANLGRVKGLHLLSAEKVGSLGTPEEYDNPRGQRLGAVPYTPRFYALLGQLLARTIYRLNSNPHKVIALDCDQTLWKGVCGEDGPEGIEVDEPRTFLQQFMVEQHAAGMLLCLCSKNNEADVWEVFQKGAMPLRREHIVSSRINWDQKSENLRSLSQELQLGLDSFIFVDDDRAVCAEVEANCPEVLTLRLPEESSTIPDLLRNYWAFDHLQVTAEDRQRTEMYRANADRNRLLEKAGSIQDFLQSLELKCEIAPLSTENVSRVSQLTQRTNQFNANGLRRNETEVGQILAEAGTKCLVVNVRDRFGDYGLVGAMVCSVQGRSLEVDTFLLSCRALGRGIEHRMLAALGGVAAETGLDQVALHFTPTKKNQPASDFLEKTGGTFREATAAGSIFRYPTQVALALTYAPDSLNEKVESGKQKAESRSLGATTDHGTPISQPRAAAGLYRIATELYRPETLLACLEPRETTRPALKAQYLAPGNEIETELVKCWEEVLKVHPVGVMDDYFELGGDSLMAVCLFVEIEEKFGRQLPLATLFEAPTIRKLGERLAGAEQKVQWRYLVPIQSEGTKPPLFCMHAAGGNVLFYRDLARHLGADQPVYGLQAREMPGTGRYLDRVEDMAAEYLKELTRVQPEGPYYLCGSSFGGLLAYEAAQQLRAQRQDVALVALFDTYGPGYPQRLANSAAPHSGIAGITARWRNLKGQLKQLEAGKRTDFIKARVKKVITKIKRKWAWRKNEFQIKYSQALGRELPKDMQRNQKAIQHALDHYVPQRYDGKLTLFRASTQPKGVARDQFLGWEKLPTRGIDVFESPGTHGAMTVDPYAKPLAQQLLPILAACHGQRTNQTPDSSSGMGSTGESISLSQLVEH
jgi:FkbH-like protein